jgi:hypothetical protein
MDVRDFRRHLDNEYAPRAFQHIVFAITDWLADRQFLGPFINAFTADTAQNRSSSHTRKCEGPDLYRPTASRWVCVPAR